MSQINSKEQENLNFNPQSLLQPFRLSWSSFRQAWTSHYLLKRAFGMSTEVIQIALLYPRWLTWQYNLQRIHYVRPYNSYVMFSDAH